MLLGQALDARLPANFLRRKKRGFNPPLKRWLRVDLAERFVGLGERLEALSAGQLARAAVDAFVGRYSAGAEHLAEQVLQLLVLDESLAQLSTLARDG
jgi:asparagine synthase (glutamine-hydrolysing)